jgi:hypothetical protein
MFPESTTSNPKTTTTNNDRTRDRNPQPERSGHPFQENKNGRIPEFCANVPADDDDLKQICAEMEKTSTPVRENPRERGEFSTVPKAGETGQLLEDQRTRGSQALGTQSKCTATETSL